MLAKSSFSHIITFNSSIEGALEREGRGRRAGSNGPFLVSLCCEVTRDRESSGRRLYRRDEGIADNLRFSSVEASLDLLRSAGKTKVEAQLPNSSLRFSSLSASNQDNPLQLYFSLHTQPHPPHSTLILFISFPSPTTFRLPQDLLSPRPLTCSVLSFRPPTPIIPPSFHPTMSHSHHSSTSSLTHQHQHQEVRSRSFSLS